jgi:transposase
MGHLLAQHLLAAGERVIDVQPKLGARVRLLAAGDVNKNDPNDARSVAVAALRSAGIREVRPDDHAAVLKVWSERYRDLGRSRTQAAYRLHAVLCELIPGGVPKVITTARAGGVLKALRPDGAVETARWELASDLLDDLRRIDARIRRGQEEARGRCPCGRDKPDRPVRVGPVIAAAAIGEVRDVSRFASRDRSTACNGTAPIEVSSGQRKVHRLSRRGNRRLNHAIHMAAIAQIRNRHSEGQAYYDKKLAEDKTRKRPLRSLTGRSAMPSSPACRPTPGGQRPVPGTREGSRGNDSASSAACSHPRPPLFGQATPGPVTTLRPQSAAQRPVTHATRE